MASQRNEKGGKHVVIRRNPSSRRGHRGRAAEQAGLLEDDDLRSACPSGECGCEAGPAGADDDDVGILVPGMRRHQPKRSGLKGAISALVA